MARGRAAELRSLAAAADTTPHWQAVVDMVSTVGLRHFAHFAPDGEDNRQFQADRRRLLRDRAVLRIRLGARHVEVPFAASRRASSPPGASASRHASSELGGGTLAGVAIARLRVGSQAMPQVGWAMSRAEAPAVQFAVGLLLAHPEDGDGWYRILYSEMVGDRRRPDWVHGCTRARRRESAMLAQRAATDRLARAGMPDVGVLHDLSNGFACARFDDLAEALRVFTTDAEVQGYFAQRREYRLVSLQGAEPVHVLPLAGAKIGDSIGPDFFVDAFAPIVAEW